MKTVIRISCLVLLSCLAWTGSYAQGLKTFKLPNGLSVYIWEDPEATDVFGMVACNVGAKDDPESLTGLAHYLEHLMFKGTEKIGALDWAKEKPLYEQIIQKYDEMAKETDPVKRKSINDEINRLTVEAAKYGLTNEFSALTEGMGGKGLNAGTSYDYTEYHNAFPAGDIYKWLELNSERLINPVFRAFQTELETVYEEYNRSQNNPNRQIQQFLLNTVFPGHPYSRPVIGFPEHLKNPQISQLIKFYQDWYVPENMALILVGNVKTNEVAGVIKEKFGRLEKRSAPAKKTYQEVPIKGRKEVKEKIAPYPQALLAYKGDVEGGEDEVALQVCLKLLTNSSRTGLLDKLTIDGDLMGASSSSFAFKDQGRIVISAIPYYDVAQFRFNSLSSTEKMILKEIKKIQEGQFEDWLVESIKSEMIRLHDLNMENQEYKAQLIMSSFIYGVDLNELFNYPDVVAALTTDKIKAVAKKYFTNDYIAMFIEKGKAPKKDELQKPGYDPLQPPRNVESEYAKAFSILPVKPGVPKYTDFNDVKVKSINDRSKLFYSTNPENEIFSLVLKYGIGTEKMPNLGLATSLMNNAGVMGQMKAQEVKQAFSNLGTMCYFSVSGSYLTVTMYGFEANLKESCNLLTRQILFPDLDEKQWNSLKGNIYQGRRMETETTDGLSNAMREYVFYQDKSNYIDRVPWESISEMSISSLTGEFQRATDYEAEVHYVGNLPFDNVYEILSANLPLKQGEKATTSPEFKKTAHYMENTIYFIPDKDAQQSNIYFYIEGTPYDNTDDVRRSAFNQYFTGGFTSLVMQEIREYRSMAYTANGYKIIPPKKGQQDYFTGYIGTQSDKVLDAIEVYMGLLQNMPQYPDRISNIKNYLKAVTLTSEPEFRDKSASVESWKLRGYTEDPQKTNLTKIDNLTFNDIVSYYNENIKGRPVVIGIVGDPKSIDLKALEKYGKVVKLSTNKLFSEK